METRVCPIPNALSYSSAPSSPGRSTSTTLNAYFFSVPTSPSRSRPLSRNPSGHESDPRTPDFRFGSLVYENGYHQQHVPIMAYADELFRGGRMLPLKLPPRLQSAGGGSYRKRSGGRIISSTSSSPGSTIPRRKALWNDEFDPFVAALEKVKASDQQHQHRPRRSRSRSRSPLKWGWGLRRSKSMGPDGATHGQSPIGVEMGLGKPVVEARRQRIKRFLVKSASLGWKTKGECRAALLWNPVEATAAARHGNAVGRISRGIKSLVKHRPRLFCRAFGLRRAPKIS